MTWDGVAEGCITLRGFEEESLSIGIEECYLCKNIIEANNRILVYDIFGQKKVKHFPGQCPRNPPQR